MIERRFFDVVCQSVNELDFALALYLKVSVANSLGTSVYNMFPEFCTAFPETAEVISKRYSAPFALFKRVSDDWACYLAAENEVMNLFFDLTPEFLASDGPEFERNCSMLPQRWKELYRYFFSIVLTERSVMPMSWKNTPFSYSGRLSLERYRQLCGVKKSVIRGFVNSTGSELMRCWLLTDDNDALFLDEKRKDHKVYHVKNHNFEDFCVLIDPESILDKYMAHYISTRSSKGFEFRQHL